MTPTFDDKGIDDQTFAPWRLVDCRGTEWADLRLQFFRWDWLQERLGGESVDDFYLNGYGLQSLLQAARLEAGLELEAEGIEYNSEGDTCLVHFESLEEATRTAALAQAFVQSKERVAALVALAREHDLEEG